MKTAMEKLIEYLDKYNEVFGMVGLSIRDRASILLEEEKEHIIGAYTAALSNCDKFPARVNSKAFSYFTSQYGKENEPI